MAVTERWVELATGVGVPYAEHGAAHGVPTVFLHPYADSHRFFDLALPHLPDTVHAYLPTQRGHGDADKPTTGYTLSHLAADLEAFLDAVGVERAVLVGHSSGGYLAQRVAVQRPERVLGLVLVGAPRSLRGRRPPFADAVEAMRDPVDAALVRQVLGTLPLMAPVPEAFVDAMVRESAKAPGRVWHEVLADLLEAVPPTDEGDITTPTRLVWGECDTVLLRPEQEALAAAIHGSELVTYPDTGHLVVWERPRRLAADVAALCRRTRWTGGS